MSGMSGLMGFAEIIAISLFLPIEYHNYVQWNITRPQSHFYIPDHLSVMI